MVLKQRITLTQPGSQLAIDCGAAHLNLPALAMPTAWLLQLYAALDNQPNSLSLETLKADLQTVFARHCDLTKADISSINVHAVYEYELTLRDLEGRLSNETLDATDDGHAFDEASYEFNDECVAVKQGERYPDPKPWHEWPG